MIVRSRVRRKPHRGSYDEQAARAVLREALFGHLAFVQDDQSYCIPMSHGLHERTLYLHGSTASRAMKIAGSGRPLCYSVTLIDGVVVARSMFNSSLNYRSCVVLGAGRVVDDPDEVSLAYRTITDHLIPGRVGDARPPTDKELRQTAFIALPLDEFSVKARSGGPVDDEDDLVLAHWADVVPARLTFGPPQPVDGASVPEYLDGYARAGGARA